MSQYNDIVAIGELLIDFISCPLNDNSIAYERKPGGAPANVLVAARKLGKKTAIISKVGNDLFGRFLKETLTAEKVDVSGLVMSDKYPTTLAFVTLDESGDRSFDFMRKLSADIMLCENELNLDILGKATVLHFGSVSMTDEPARSATFRAVQLAKQAGAYISYDPNYREALWDSKDNAVLTMRQGLKYADVVKVSDSELELLTGETDLPKGAQKLLSEGISFVFVTLGPNGCYYASRSGEKGFIPGFHVETIDTTGAGDAFVGAALSKLIDCKFSPKDEELMSIARFACAVGALSTTKRGAISAMPTQEEIRVFLSKNETIKA